MSYFTNQHLSQASLSNYKGILTLGYLSCLICLEENSQALLLKAPCQALGSKVATGCVRLPSATGLSEADPPFQFIPIATDYRDQRKAAFQEYAIGKTCNIVRLPRRLSFEQGSTIGVAFVAAALALGVRMGPDFLPFFDGPDLYQVLRDISPEDLPADVLQECLEAIQGHERIRPGDWIAIWGGK